MAPTAGLLWVNSKISKPDSITPANFKKWYEEVHIPDIFATSGIKTAFRYENIDPSADRPYFAMYPTHDVNFLGSEEYNAIPVKSDYFPGPSHNCFEYADFDARYYEWVQGFEKEGAMAGPAKLIISAALTPAVGTDEDFDNWYRQEHLGTVSKCTGYVRTRRYKLKTAVTAKDVPTYLALHEFESDSLPQEELMKTAETPWGKKVMGSLAAQEIYVFRLTGSFGDVKAKF